MGLLDMNQSEHVLWEELIAESAKLVGQECLLYQIDTSTADLNGDAHVTYKDPVKANILFEENPKPVIKKMGWQLESDDLPYVAYITSLDDNYSRVVIEKNVKVVVPNNLGEVDLLVSNVVGSKVNPLFWTCKLVPYRYNLDNDEVDKNPDDYDNASIVESGEDDPETEVDESASNPNYSYFRKRS